MFTIDMLELIDIHSLIERVKQNVDEVIYEEMSVVVEYEGVKYRLEFILKKELD